MKIDNKKVDLFYDLMDKACMTYYYDNKKDYLEAFIAFTKVLDTENYDSNMSSEAIKKLEKIVDDIYKNDFLNEEIRLASELVLIKGYKHRNMRLDFLTPDTINYLFSYLINTIIKSDEKYQKKSQITVMDTVLGAGNMLQTVINNSEKEIIGIGIEKDELLAHLASSLSNLLDNDLVVNINDAKEEINTFGDIIIGDFGENQEIYDIILKRLDNIIGNGYFAYLINNDFFALANTVNKDFRERLMKEATLMGLIVLPKSFVKENHIGKSILIGKKELMSDYQMSVITIDDTSNENMAKAITKINKMFEKNN